MGMDAEVHVWYGVAGEEYGTIDYEALDRIRAEARRRSKYPEEFDEYNDYFDPWEVDGVELSLFDSGEGAEPHGFGVKLFSTDWDYPPKPWNEVVAKVEQEVTLKAHIVDRVLDELEIPGERGIYLQTRYW